MHIILGGTGNIGAALAENLLGKGEKVTVISHDQKKQQAWESKGAKVAIVDIFEEDKLRAVFNSGERLFLLNPPAAPSTDTVAKEKESLAAIFKALKGSGIKKVVAESTYGAQPGEGKGDLGVLYSMEQSLAEMDIPASIIRGAYYMSNWGLSLASVQESGKLYTLYPADFKLPMVSPKDIGHYAATLMLEPIEKTGLHFMEGPEKYSAQDVSEAFAAALKKPVEVVSTPKDQWVKSLEQNGFSANAAKAMAIMTEITLEEQYEKPEKPIRGETTLKEYISLLVS